MNLMELMLRNKVHILYSHLLLSFYYELLEILSQNWCCILTIVISHQGWTIMNLFTTNSTILKSIKDVKRNSQSHNNREGCGIASMETYRSNIQKSNRGFNSMSNSELFGLYFLTQTKKVHIFLKYYWNIYKINLLVPVKLSIV